MIMLLSMIIKNFPLGFPFGALNYTKEQVIYYFNVQL